MINRLPPHTKFKVQQLAIWAREFRVKPKPVLICIALNPTWKTTNLNERGVALEALIHRRLIEKVDIDYLFDFLIDDTNFPIIIREEKIFKDDIPEGVDKSDINEALKFTKNEFQRTNARLRCRAAEIIVEHILQNDNLFLLEDFNRAVIEIIENMMREPYFFDEISNKKPSEHLINFLTVLYLTDTDTALKMMNTIGINEKNLYLSLNQRSLLKSHNERLINDYMI